MSSPLSGFTAVPNPQMLAFMGAQSFVMMYQAGEGWQYGKRKISAMSNEDFNKLTPLKLLQNQSAVLRTAIGTIEKSMNDMTPMIRTIIRQYGDFLKEIVAVAPPVISDVSATVVKQAVKQTTGQDITLQQGLAIAQGLFGPARNVIEAVFPSAEARRGSTQTTYQSTTSPHAQTSYTGETFAQRQARLRGQTLTIPNKSELTRRREQEAIANFREYQSEAQRTTGVSIGKAQALKDLKILEDAYQRTFTQMNMYLMQISKARSSAERERGLDNFKREKVKRTALARRIVLKKVEIGKFKF